MHTGGGAVLRGEKGAAKRRLDADENAGGGSDLAIASAASHMPRRRDSLILTPEGRVGLPSTRVMMRGPFFHPPVTRVAFGVSKSVKGEEV